MLYNVDPEFDEMLGLRSLSPDADNATAALDHELRKLDGGNPIDAAIDARFRSLHTPASPRRERAGDGRGKDSIIEDIAKHQRALLTKNFQQRQTSDAGETDLTVRMKSLFHALKVFFRGDEERQAKQAMDSLDIAAFVTLTERVFARQQAAA